MLRSKQRSQKDKKAHRVPANCATKELLPFPRYPPKSWVIYKLSKQNKNKLVYSQQSIY